MVVSTANARFFMFMDMEPSTGQYATIVGIFEEQYKVSL